MFSREITLPICFLSTKTTSELLDNKPIDEVVDLFLEDKPIYGTNLHKYKIRAKINLLHDLNVYGCKCRVTKISNKNFSLYLNYENEDHSKEFIREQIRPRREELIIKNSSWIMENERWISSFFLKEKITKPLEIYPILEECITKKQKDLFRYCRFMSNVPFSDHIGRRIQFLIRDASISNCPIIGIAALGSSVRQLSCRDSWIGWNSSSEKSIKVHRMTNCMDLYTAVSLPPYNSLLGGKLISYMMVSNEVRGIFADKYRSQISMKNQEVVNDLVMIITTSFYGLNSSQYNRIKYGDKKIFLPIGETKGYSTIQFSENTFSAFRTLVSYTSKSTDSSLSAGANWRLRILRQGLRELNLDEDYFLKIGHKRGVYISPLADNTKEYLTGKTNEISYYDYPLENLVSYWKDRWLRQRIKNEFIKKEINNYDCTKILLSKQINAIEK